MLMRRRFGYGSFRFLWVTKDLLYVQLLIVWFGQIFHSKHSGYFALTLSVSTLSLLFADHFVFYVHVFLHENTLVQFLLTVFQLRHKFCSPCQANRQMFRL